MDTCRTVPTVTRAGGVFWKVNAKVLVPSLALMSAAALTRGLARTQPGEPARSLRERNDCSSSMISRKVCGAALTGFVARTSSPCESFLACHMLSGGSAALANRPPPRRIQSAARVPTVFTGEHAGAADEKNDSSCARPSSSAAAVPRKCPRPSTSVEAASRADGDPTHPPPPSPPQSMLAGVMYGRGTAPRAWANLVRGAPATMSPRAGFRISNFQD